MSDILAIADMDTRHWLTREVAEYYYQAASVCLDRHHTSPTQAAVENEFEKRSAELSWMTIDQKIRDNWGNELDATRDGAYACALAAVELLLNLKAIRRAENRTGADYYIGQGEQGKIDLESVRRLEVSGIDKDNPKVIKSRLKEKVEQAKKGNSNIPAIACVVGFQTPRIVMQSIE